MAWPVAPSSTPGSPDPLDGLHDPALLPDAGRRCWPDSRARGTRGERVLVFGDFDADGLTGLAILVLALRRFGDRRVEPYVPSRLDEGHGLSLAALDAAAAAGATARSSRSTAGRRARAEIAEARRARASTSSSPTTTACPPVLPAGARARQPASAGLDLPGPPAGGERRRVQGRPAAARATSRAAGRRRSTWPTSRRSGRSPTSPRSSARTGRSRGSGSNGCGARRGPGIAALLERARIAPAAVDLETVAFALAPRLNAAGRVGEALEAARLLLADGPGRGGAVHADALEAANRPAAT